MPTDLQALLVLLLFIAPGFLFTRAYGYGLPRYHREPDAFQQMITSIVASTGIHLLLFAIAAGILIIWQPDVSPLSGLTRPLTALAPHELVLLLVSLIIYIGASLFLGWIGGALWQKLSTPALPLWWLLVAEPFAQGFQPQVTVRLANEQELTGLVGDARWIGSKEVTYELTLRNIQNLPNAELLVTSKDVVWIARAS